MKRTLFIAIISVVAACGGGKKDKPADVPPAGSAAMAPTMAGSAAMAPTMAGSAAAAPTMAGSAAAAPTMAAGSAAAPAATPAAKPTAKSIPSQADYEAKAATEVTAKNAAAQLDDLEKDLN